MERPADKIYAAREFILKGSHKTVRAILLNPESDGQDYYCEYKIDGLNSDINGRAFGVDSMQALIHGLNSLGAALYFSEDYKNGLLSWVGDRKDGSLGIPVESSIADLVPSVD